jgi:hypothetical protein
VLDERFDLDARGLSVVAVLLLRGSQTVGELRARTERMADFGSLDDVSAELERMASGSDPLVCRLPRRPGQKEERWAQQLSASRTETDVDSDSVPELDAAAVDSDSVSELDASATDAAVAVRSVSLDDVVTSLRADVDALREEVQRISAIVEELRSTLGS